MNFLLAALLASYGAMIVSAASNTTVDQNTLRQNGVAAQTLNAEFQTLKKSDPCDSGQMACISGALAQCAFGSWQLQPCSRSQHCFALPSVNTSGTILTCTSEAHALSLMTAVGMTGGLSANSTNATVAFPTQPAPSASTSTSSNTGSSLSAATSLSSGAVAVITVTVTLPLTMPPSTTTLRPHDALSILASLSSAGYSVTPLALTSSVSSPASSTGAAVSASSDAPCEDPADTGLPTAPFSAKTGTPTNVTPYRRNFRR